MVNYNNAMIYRLCCRNTDITDIYIGSTTNFRNRKCQHKYSCNNSNSNNYNCKVYQFIRENLGWENWDMVLIENVKCNTKLELHQKERKFIEELKPSLNQTLPSRTSKEYYIENKEKIKEKHSEYYIENKEKAKEYYNNNKEKIKEYNIEYRENNLEKIKENSKEKITCECGSIVAKKNIIRHKTSMKHINLLS